LEKVCREGCNDQGKNKSSNEKTHSVSQRHVSVNVNIQVETWKGLLNLQLGE
jgi:hypothetical protein